MAIGIGEMDTVIVISEYAISQNNTTGRINKNFSSSKERWGKVEQLSESRTLLNSGISYTSAYKITILREVGVKTTSQSTITLPTGEILSIGAVVQKEIGRLWVEEITAYTNE